MRFSEVFKSLIEENAVDLKCLSKETDIHLATLYYYLKHDTHPDLVSAVKLSEYFNCSIQYNMINNLI